METPGKRRGRARGRAGAGTDRLVERKDATGATNPAAEAMEADMAAA